MNNREQLTKLIKKYSLSADDVYVHEKGWKIIKRRGYKQIQKKLDIEILFDVPHAGENYAVVVAKGQMTSDDKRIYITRSTTGEASPRNSSFEYPVAVAQKRAEGKLILEMADLYQEGYMTEDEVDLSVKSNALIEKNEKVGKKSVDETEKLLGIKAE